MESIDHVPIPPNSLPPSERLTPGAWLKKNLFSSPLNAILSVVFGALALYLFYRFARFIFVTGRWEPVHDNLELFMVGLYPREERWRLIAQLITLGGAVGFALGSMRASARDRAMENGLEYTPENWRTYVSSYWAVVVFVLVVLVVFVRTPGPWLLAGATIIAAIIGRTVTAYLPRRLRTLGWTLAAVAAVVELQFLTGTGGWAWFYITIALIPLANDEIGRLFRGLPANAGLIMATAALAIGVATLVIRRDFWAVFALLAGIYALFLALQGDRIDAARVAAVMIIGVLAYYALQAIGLEGVDWAEWGGFHLNLVATAVATLLAFPLGVLLALGRRSSLPAIKVMSVAYIEFFRGAPLITFLLSAQFFIGFFLDTDTPMSLITRAIAAITLFSAAYIAEIVRGGLQAVPQGQIEAGQAGGLSQAKIMRLIVMPQALRAVIPAMVGQFISLFKDTTLFTIIGISEFLDVRGIVHGQEAFRGFGIGETLTFVAFGFWALAFTSSRESQRLERRLNVGQH